VLNIIRTFFIVSTLQASYQYTLYPLPTVTAPPSSSQAFFARPAEQVAPELIGSLLVKRQDYAPRTLARSVDRDFYYLLPRAKFGLVVLPAGSIAGDW